MYSQISKLAELVDYQADFTALIVTDDDVQFSKEKQELKNNLLQDFRHCIEVEISKKKTCQDINVLQGEQNALAYKKQELRKIVQEKIKEKNISDDKKTLYEKILNLYRRNLGFQIVKSTTDESDITFVFSNINKKKPLETFSISLMTDGIIYKVVSCQPPIDSLEELVTDLCESNDLSKFILQARRKFCSVSTSNNAK